MDEQEKEIEEYVRNQMQQDLEYDQMSLKEYIDPFTGEPVNKAQAKALQGLPVVAMRMANLQWLFRAGQYHRLIAAEETTS